MDKGGQIYILAALLLGVVIYSVTSVVNEVRQDEVKGDFEPLSENFEIESSKLINSVLKEGGDVPSSFANFTLLFTSYSKSKSPNFFLFYALGYDNDLHLGNFMNDEIQIYTPCPDPTVCDASEVLEGCLSNVSAQIVFDGLSIDSAYLRGDFDNMSSECIKNLSLVGLVEYCANIGGFMYNISVNPNAPEVFSLSRLKSGNQILNSLYGDVGQQKICTGRVDPEGEGGTCCTDFCCWDYDTSACLEGGCDGGTMGSPPVPPPGVCRDPPSTPINTCTPDLPWYCNENQELVRNCTFCGCPGAFPCCDAPKDKCYKHGC